MALVYNLVFFFLLEKMGEGPSNVVLSFFSMLVSRWPGYEHYNGALKQNQAEG